MPTQVSYPGVYVEEIPSGVRTITGVATSITAFLGLAQRGPVNEATMINSYGDFERIFGGLWLKSTLGYAVRDFYQHGGSQAIIVRLISPNYPTEAAASAAKKDAADAAAAADAISTAVQSATDVAGAKSAAATAAETFTTEIQKAAAQSVEKAVRDSTEADLTKFKKLAEEAASANKAPDDPQKAQLKLGDAANQLVLEAVSEGAWGSKLRARVDFDVLNETELSQSYKDNGVTSADLFNLTVRDMNTGLTELFRNVSVKPGLREVSKVLENESNLVRVYSKNNERPANSDKSEDDKKIQPFSDDDVKDSKRSIGVAAVDKGVDSTSLDINDFTGNGLENAKKGLYALEKADLFNLLCIPPYLNGDDVDQTLVSQAATYCEKRRAFLLVDPPSGWKDKDNAKEGLEGDKGITTRSNHAAVFFPRLRQPNPLRDNQAEEFAPCGAIAGIFARTDAQRGVWKAPAGLDARLSVPELSVSLTDLENGELNPLGINCLRVRPGVGRVVWGSRTLEGNDRLASEWKYIPVRRLALFMEESLYRGTQWAVFEPNDEPLWSQLRLNIGAFMNTLFRQGAFQGRSPQEAYFVRCDKETTTQTDINSGIVNIVVGFAPLKPAEFVVLKFQQIAGQIAV